MGGESTRPGARARGRGEELHRVLPVVERLAAARRARVSIDTTKARGRPRPRSTPAPRSSTTSPPSAPTPGWPALVADAGVDCCLMHMRGEPRTMQDDPRYDDVVSDVKAFLEERLAFAVGEGVAEERVWLDPGIGFGKTVDHNLELLRRLDEIVAIGRPVVVGTSRKCFLGKLAGPRRDERLPGTIATNVHGATSAAPRVFRVHDVAPSPMP